MENHTNGDSTKKWKFVYGPVYPEIEKGEMITIPTEKAGYITRKDMERLSEEFLEIPVKDYIVKRDTKGKVIERRTSSGKTITKKSEGRGH